MLVLAFLENASPDTGRVIVWAGNNDLHRESFDFSIAKLWKMSLTNIRKAFPGASIWVVQTVCPPDAPALQKSNCRKTNQLLSSYRSVSLISLDTKVLTFRRDQISLERQSADGAFAVTLETRGQSFVVAPRCTSAESLASGVRDFGERLAVSAARGFKRELTVNDGPPLPRRPTASIDPSRLRPEIQAALAELDDVRENIRDCRNAPNISQAEAKALRDLRADKSIVIKPADKGSQLVILDRQDYVRECLRQLDDPAFYRPLNEPINRFTAQRIRAVFQSLLDRRLIDKRQFTAFCPKEEFRTRRFYILPKIHKPAESWPLGDIPPGRPIVSDVDSESYASGRFIDSFLQPIVIQLPSFIRDTDHFQAAIRDITCPARGETFLFTMDVASLYTNIPTAAGLECVQRAFREHPDARRPDASLLSLLKLNLERNDFEFDGKFFLQVKGTAMGKSFAPSYSNIYMGYWEQRGLELSPQKPALWLRYIDDIFGVWHGTRDELVRFHELLDGLDPNIRLQLSYSSTEVNFLDTTVFWDREGDVKRLATKVYFKPTDSRTLIHRDSFHPKRTFRGVVKSQLLRYARRCSLMADFDAACTGLFSSLVQHQGYNRRFLRTIKYEMLTELGFYPTRRWEFGFLPCNPTRLCRCCQAHARFASVCPGSAATTVQLIISQRIDCNATNAVYAVFCRRCDHTIYVGETANSIRGRMLAHIGDIRHARDTPVARHFTSDGHSLADFAFTGIWSRDGTGPRANERRQRHEAKLIEVLKTQTPHGVNELAGTLHNPAIPLILPHCARSDALVAAVKDRVARCCEAPVLPAYTKGRNLRQLLCPSRLDLLLQFENLSTSSLEVKFPAEVDKIWILPEPGQLGLGQPLLLLLLAATTGPELSASQPGPHTLAVLICGRLRARSARSRRACASCTDPIELSRAEVQERRCGCCCCCCFDRRRCFTSSCTAAGSAASAASSSSTILSEPGPVSASSLTSPASSAGTFPATSDSAAPSLVGAVSISTSSMLVSRQQSDTPADAEASAPLRDCQRRGHGRRASMVVTSVSSARDDRRRTTRRFFWPPLLQAPPQLSSAEQRPAFDPIEHPGRLAPALAPAPAAGVGHPGARPGPPVLPAPHKCKNVGVEEQQQQQSAGEQHREAGLVRLHHRGAHQLVVGGAVGHGQLHAAVGQFNAHPGASCEAARYTDSAAETHRQGHVGQGAAPAGLHAGHEADDDEPVHSDEAEQKSRRWHQRIAKDVEKPVPDVLVESRRDDHSAYQQVQHRQGDHVDILRQVAEAAFRDSRVSDPWFDSVRTHIYLEIDNQESSSRDKLRESNPAGCSFKDFAKLDETETCSTGALLSRATCRRACGPEPNRLQLTGGLPWRRLSSSGIQMNLLTLFDFLRGPNGAKNVLPELELPVTSPAELPAEDDEAMARGPVTEAAVARPARLVRRVAVRRVHRGQRHRLIGFADYRQLRLFVHDGFESPAESLVHAAAERQLPSDGRVEVVAVMQAHLGFRHGAARYLAFACSQAVERILPPVAVVHHFVSPGGHRVKFPVRAAEFAVPILQRTKSLRRRWSPCKLLTRLSSNGRVGRLVELQVLLTGLLLNQGSIGGGRRQQSLFQFVAFGSKLRQSRLSVSWSRIWATSTSAAAEPAAVTLLADLDPGRLEHGVTRTSPTSRFKSSEPIPPDRLVRSRMLSRKNTISWASGRWRQRRLLTIVRVSQELEEQLELTAQLQSHMVHTRRSDALEISGSRGCGAGSNASASPVFNNRKSGGSATSPQRQLQPLQQPHHHNHHHHHSHHHQQQQDYDSRPDGRPRRLAASENGAHIGDSRKRRLRYAVSTEDEEDEDDEDEHELVGNGGLGHSEDDDGESLDRRSRQPRRVVERLSRRRSRQQKRPRRHLQQSDVDENVDEDDEEDDAEQAAEAATVSKNATDEQQQQQFSDMYTRVKRPRKKFIRDMYGQLVAVENQVSAKGRRRNREAEEEEDDEEEGATEEDAAGGGGGGQQRRPYQLRQHRRRTDVYQTSAYEAMPRRSRGGGVGGVGSSREASYRRRQRSSSGRACRRRRRSLQRNRHGSSSTESSSSSSSGSDSADDNANDERRFLRRKNRSMAKARLRCLPMNLAMQDAERGIRRDRSKIGASLADVDPMSIDTGVTFESIGGLGDHLRSLKEMLVFPMLYPEVFAHLRVDPPRGVLFYGPPGCGKTLVARALANECGRADARRKVAFFMRKGADCLSKWVGESERQLRLLFDQAYQMRPSIIFFDEIDGLAPVRSTRQDQIHSSIVSTLLALMDGLDARGEVIVIGATNRLDSIDPALRRPGRFDRELRFSLPNEAARLEILRLHLGHFQLSEETLRSVAESTAGYCGADLKALSTEAGLSALRRAYPQIYYSKDKLLLDNARISVSAGDLTAALVRVRPAGQRSTPAVARPPPAYLNPLYSDAAADAADRLPAGRQAGRPAEWKPTPASHAAWTDWRLIWARPFCTEWESLPAHCLDPAALYASASVRCPEEAVADLFRELRRAAPAALYVPACDSLFGDSSTGGLSDTVRRCLLASLRDFDPSLPLLVLMTRECINLDADEIGDSFQPPDWLDCSSEDLVTVRVTSPTDAQRRAFFSDMVLNAATVLDDADGGSAENFRQPSRCRRCRWLRPVRRPALTPAEAKRLARREEGQLRELRIFLRDTCNKLARDRRFFVFAKPVTDVADYYDIIKNPMDLATVMDKIDRGDYCCAEDFLADVDLISRNALEYNPVTDDESVAIRHRACALRDVAQAIVKAEMDSDFERTTVNKFAIVDAT
uniref:Bromo domain-containing protein n=1 Tax=Macrostomum lignano TaxID=282301 RepID=A0A1I8HME7_9PLAT